MKKRFIAIPATLLLLGGLYVHGSNINATCVPGNADYEAGTGLCNVKNRAADNARAQAAADRKAAKATEAAEVRVTEDARHAELPQNEAIGCAILASKGLKDPDSFRQLNSVRDVQSTRVVEFTATNGFGGRVRSTFSCTTLAYIN